MKDGRTGADHCRPDITQHSSGCDDLQPNIMKCKCDSPYTWNSVQEICDYKISCKTNLMKDGKTGEQHCRPDITQHSIGCDDSTGVLKCKCESPYTWNTDKESCMYKISCSIDRMKDGRTGDDHCKPEITQYSIGCDDSNGSLKCKCLYHYIWDSDKEMITKQVPTIVDQLLRPIVLVAMIGEVSSDASATRLPIGTVIV
ncbi:uncharacterized protein LOC128953252 [Oppia nitens]|uniref:uncharacterized protein LOC128953252 n=1 Tax=Oppia nitens TaxID=1686743 RepID=UPI0023DA9535|nr:uncharacterized protein LOC128953252 [Oppia nitens]